jgi:hypothetical protein
MTGLIFGAVFSPEWLQMVLRRRWEVETLHPSRRASTGSGWTSRL